MEELPSFNEIVTLGVVVACAVSALVQVVKPIVKKEISPDYSPSALRALSMLAGGGFGQALYGAIAQGHGWPWGTIIGFGAGSLATVIVAQVKKKIKDAGNTSED